MAIQVYDMGLDFTKGEGTSISDFRLKQAQASQADATANKYRAETDAAARDAKTQAGRKAALIEASKRRDADGNPYSDEDTHTWLSGQASGRGDFEAVKAITTASTAMAKEKRDQQTQELDIQKKRQAAVEPIASAVRANATISGLSDARNHLEHLAENVDPGFNSFLEPFAKWYDENIERLTDLEQTDPEAAAAEIKTKIDSLGLLSSERYKTKQFNSGGITHSVREDRTGDIINTQSPDNKVNNETKILGQISTASTAASAEEGRMIRHKDKISLKREFKLAELKGKATKASLKIAADNLSLDATIDLAQRLELLVDENPSSTATPFRGLNAVAMTIWATVFPDYEGITPSIESDSMRNLLVATATELNKRGRISNQARKRIEGVLGGNFLTTPATMKKGIKEILKLLKAARAANPDGSHAPVTEVDDNGDPIPAVAPVVEDKGEQVDDPDDADFWEDD